MTTPLVEILQVGTSPTWDVAWRITVTAAATVATGVAFALYRKMNRVLDMVENHDHALYGIEDVHGWEGIVERVADHETEIYQMRNKKYTDGDTEKND